VNYLASVDVVSREAYRIQSVVGQQILEPEDGSTIKNERFDREFFSFRYLNSLQCTAGFLAEAIAVQKNLKIRRLAVQKMKGGKITGIVTLMSVVGNIPSQSIELADVQLPKELVGAGRGIISFLIVTRHLKAKMK
jgi:hypothetical protein